MRHLPKAETRRKYENEVKVGSYRQVINCNSIYWLDSTSNGIWQPLCECKETLHYWSSSGCITAHFSIRVLKSTGFHISFWISLLDIWIYKILSPSCYPSHYLLCTHLWHSSLPCLVLIQLVRAVNQHHGSSMPSRLPFSWTTKMVASMASKFWPPLSDQYKMDR